MQVFTVTARFPLGEFNAHGAGNAPEWPPAPARLAAAFLAAAHREGVGVATAEHFFSLRAPEVSAPQEGHRDTGFSRWVPVNNELKVNAAGTAVGIIDARERFGQKAQKDPERGVPVGTGPDDVVRWVYEDETGAIDLAELDLLARRVEYLGRPTSPVILDVVAGRAQVPGASSLWVPDELGSIEMRVATPELLAALDMREEQRRRSRVTGTHPALDVRPVARYRLVDDKLRTAGPVLPPRQLLEGAVLFRFPAGEDLDVALIDEEAPIVVDQLIGGLENVSWALPLFGTAGRRETPVLRGVLVRDSGPRRVVPLATRSGVVTARPTEPRSLASLPLVIRSAVGSSMGWTTLLPTALSDEDVLSTLASFADGRGAQIDWIGAHTESCASVGPDADGLTDRRHVSVVFDREVPGPLIIDRMWMVPVGADGLAVNALRSKLR
ncbi:MULTISPECIES: type I-U CRISPR-associated protein Csb2 [unclassified Actinomyces]|uniref:type I-G CRISPR-associated protein Csb2 n=1 Tax=unclassified Actinomyces TaxID=2609248 RepID=UPI002016F1E5|nr:MULTISPECIES: type I-U CRISPR-associated protein Csb2 [unclassified Actinomyces]MCL3777884.1 type I-U CRISPR-associated protein Cas5/Cas6 [Actinomyces sp. AC-20-1]MCL3789235.1 type I-U CRISPR-associated protein Cas5/Cas6 [Actinomyces sp. 187325]MCL3791588.1 type I-U CRISPR-associated protein Cas5/Cas6 [Actinomyces sp. 186855]MCL3793530.1 type I-U CRISPR-associated protein Cas5/Cas6 [Actinomyces sp. 217892]